MTNEPVKYSYSISNPQRLLVVDVVYRYPDVRFAEWRGTFDSVEEAIEDARDAWRDRHGYYPGRGECVAVVPVERYKPELNAYHIIGDICSDACEAAGDAAERFVKELHEIPQEGRKALCSALQVALCEWLEQNGIVPGFGVLRTSSVTYYPLWEEEAR